MRDLALILSKGSNGIGMNKRESALYFKKAADLGNVDSMLKYAMMVDAGEGVEIDSTSKCIEFAQQRSTLQTVSKRISRNSLNT